MTPTHGRTTREQEPPNPPVARLIRKEKPLPDPRPPVQPPAPGGVKTPGNSGSPGKMICLAADVIEQTVLESQAQKSLRKPGALGGKSMHVTVVEGEDKGTSFDVTGVGTYTIGRKECDIVLNDEKVSRKHASIVVISGEQYAVTDLASRNGTFVNGVRLTRRNLQHNDLIRIGNTTLRFTVFDGPVAVKS
ncbi:MAG TPA: FHA domain-containing protein [Candidatus Polarisedimenticolia bacterium]|nr:FHA domain-containing protein [Candidatus Polarisedimenticolia bacterium]